MNVVIYARYSSDTQREESITAQIRACTDYAAQKGYNVVKVYTDEARSAMTDNRPRFMQMIQDIKHNFVKADVVLVHKLDRFARNRYDSAFYRRELRKANVKLESVLEHLDDSPESVLLESLIEGMAEYYSKNLAREVNKGMRETALQAKHCGGRPPLGYDVDKDKKYITNEEETQAVRTIFNMYAEDHGYKNIMDTLNNQGYKTKMGRPFSKNGLHEILRNKKYIGIYTFNRSASKSPDGTRNSHRNKENDEIIELPDACQRLYPQKFFGRCKKKWTVIKENTPAAGTKAKWCIFFRALFTAVNAT